MDFTLKTYKQLLNALRNQGFSFLTFEGFMTTIPKKVIVLRHDVDALPINSLEFAKIQADLEIKGSYYFRAVPGSWDEAVIREIAGLGHEIGYHYEDVSLVDERRQASGVRHQEEDIVKLAIESFSKNLEKLRRIVPVKTICMHGSPMSRWDSRLLWKYYDYKDFGIIGEPYFDINFDEVLYLTDTGRRWDGDSFNVRDKASGVGRQASGEEKKGKVSLTPHASRLTPFPRFHSTSDIIKAAENNQLPDKLMMTFHPQRWTDKLVPWVRELVWQNVKNVGKYFLVKIWND